MTPAGGPPPYVAVALPIPLRKLFTYRLGAAPVGLGARVHVPLGRRRVIGTVVGFPEAPPEGDVELKETRGPAEEGRVVPPALLALTRFVADYYLCSWGDAIEAALPRHPGPEPEVRWARRRPGADAGTIPARASARRRAFEQLPEDGSAVPASSLDDAGRRALTALAQIDLVELSSAPAPVAAEACRAPEPPLTPTPAQAEVLARLEPAIADGGFRPFLLFGATGSGKTEVYLQAAAAALDAGRDALYLVPEIGLTPLLVDKLMARFPGRVVWLHSGLSVRERYRHWRRVLQATEPLLVVGTRSAVFAPLKRPGLIVVDEEQDASYKQEETPRYHARDLAVWRAREVGAVLVLGSATPSMETFHNAVHGRYERLELGGRVESRPLPEVSIVDMRREFEEAGEIRPLSRELVGRLADCVERGEQAIVLRNRRGWAAALFCPVCGERVGCPQCSLALTWHRAARRLRCHLCAFETTRPARCPRCDGDELRLLGEGSERIEDELKAALPGLKVARMDRDTMRRKEAHHRLLREFDRGDFDVLTGTQMIAKGHDFHRVTVVGILSADQTLGLPDFRAAERTFQLLTQVAGRAGRGTRPGRVVVQAFDPGHPVLKQAAGQDFAAFYDREVRYRRALRYPPLTAMVQLRIVDRDELRAYEWAEETARALRAEGGERLLISGPGPAPIERAKGYYRQQILVRTAGRRRLVETVDRALGRIEGVVPARAIQVDVDPQSLM